MDQQSKKMHRTLTTPNTCWWSNRNSLSFIAGGNAKGYSHFGRQFGGFFSTTYTLTAKSNNCTPWYLSKGVDNLCSHKNMDMDVDGNLIHNCQSLGATKMPFSRWLDSYIAVYPDNGIVLSTEKKPIWKVYILCNSNSMIFGKTQRSEDSKKEQWLLETGRG